MAALDSGLLCALLLESGCASHSGIPQNLRVRLGWRPSRSQAYGTYPPLQGRRRWFPRVLVTIIACEQVLFERPSSWDAQDRESRRQREQVYAVLPPLCQRVPYEISSTVIGGGTC